MLKKNVWICLLLAVVFLPSTLLAQEMMHGKWWNDKSVIEELALTDSERNVLNEKYSESRRKMIDLKSEIEKQRFELDLLLDDEDMDRKKIMARFESLEKARAELSKERFEMLMEVRGTIGAQRFQDLKSMHRARDRKEVKRFLKDRSRYKDWDRD